MEQTDFAEMQRLRLAASMARTGILSKHECDLMLDNLPTIRLEYGEDTTDKFMELCEKFACEVEIGRMTANQAGRMLEDKPLEMYNSTLSLIEVLYHHRGKEYFKHLELKKQFE